jgi:hypothetical protein
VVDRIRHSERTSASLGKHLGALALIAAAVALAYGNALGTGFFFDAKALVRDNPILRAATVDAVRFIFTSDYWQPMASDGLYRPLTMLSFLSDWSVLGHGGEPYWYVRNVPRTRPARRSRTRSTVARWAAAPQPLSSAWCTGDDRGRRTSARGPARRPGCSPRSC